MKIPSLIPVLLGATFIVAAFPQTSSAQQAEMVRANQLMSQNKLDEAMNLLLETQTSLISRLATEKDAATITKLRDNLADVRSLLGYNATLRFDGKQALAYYQQAYDYNIVLRRNKAAIDLLSLANAYRITRDFPQTISYAERALTLAIENRDKWTELRVLDELAKLYEERNIEKSVGYYVRIANIHLRDKDRGAEIETLSRIADVYHRAGKTELALDYLTRALEISEEIKTRENEPVRQMMVLNAIAEVYFDAKQFEKSIEYFEPALVIATETRSDPAEPNLIRRIAAAYEKLNRPEKTIEYLERALPHYHPINEPSGYTEILVQLRNLYVAQKQPQLALARGEAIINNLKSALERLSREKGVDIAATSYYWVQGEMDNIKALRTLLIENGRAADAKKLDQWCAKYATNPDEKRK